jgi:hypothetical protein
LLRHPKEQETIMNQLSNAYVEHALVVNRQAELLNTRTPRLGANASGSGPIRQGLGAALIRIGEFVRGRSVTIAPVTEDDREIALRLAA